VLPPSAPAIQPKSKNCFLAGTVDVDVDMSSTSPKIVHKELDLQMIKNTSHFMSPELKPTLMAPTQMQIKDIKLGAEASMMSTSSSKSNDVD
jgi:hypothetical protein